MLIYRALPLTLLRTMRRQDIIEAALGHLQDADPVLCGLIVRVGEFTLRPNADRFGMLVRSILRSRFPQRPPAPSASG